MQRSNWREEIELDEFIGGIASAGLKAFEITQKALKKGIGKTAAGKPQYKKNPEKDPVYKPYKEKTKAERMADPDRGINSPAFKKFMADRGM